MSLEDSVKSLERAILLLAPEVVKLCAHFERHNEIVADALKAEGIDPPPQKPAPRPQEAEAGGKKAENGKPPPESTFDGIVAKMKDFSNEAKKVDGAQEQYARFGALMQIYFDVEVLAELRERPETWKKLERYIDSLSQTLKEKGVEGMADLRLDFMTDKFLKRVKKMGEKDADENGTG